MINVTALVGPGVTEIAAHGHESHGGDVDRRGQVCAAVTAITRTALLGLEALAQMYPDQLTVIVTDRHEQTD